MAGHRPGMRAIAAALALGIAALAWWPYSPAPPGARPAPRGLGQWPAPDAPGPRTSVARAPAAEHVPVPSADPAADIPADNPADPLLTPGLRHTLEAWLLEAGPASDPSVLKQRLPGRVAGYFPASLATRALALAERYVDWRVALGEMPAPPDLLGALDPQALRKALQARQDLARRWFDAAEYQALFAREDALEHYTLARLEIARHPALTAAQRVRALQATQQLLSPALLAQRDAASAHIAAAAQTAAFNAQNTHAAQRHAARSALYGAPAAQALAALDQQEQRWQQRLELLRQASSGDPAAAHLLQQQPLTAQELLRVDAALALRQLSSAGNTAPR